MYYVVCIMRKFSGFVGIAAYFILQTASPVYAATCDPNNPNPIDCGAGLQQLEDLFQNIISVVVGLAFIATLVMLISAGFKYLTSGGEPKAIQQAHQTVTWTLLGILFLAIAWLVLQLIENVTGVKVTIFDIKQLCGAAGVFCN